VFISFVVAQARIEPFYKELGRSIQAFRVKAGLSQEKLGASLRPRVTRASIANIEGGKQRILTHTLVQLSAALDVDISLLIPKDEDLLRSSVPDQIEAQLAEHNVPRRVIKQLAAQLRRSRGEKRR
jgi:transcriptional regulator with XRE-family HTH domain